MSVFKRIKELENEIECNCWHEISSMDMKFIFVSFRELYEIAKDHMAGSGYSVETELNKRMKKIFLDTRRCSG